jgi:hypothetical protein
MELDSKTVSLQKLVAGAAMLVGTFGHTITATENGDGDEAMVAQILEAMDIVVTISL